MCQKKVSKKQIKERIAELEKVIFSKENEEKLPEELKTYFEKNQKPNVKDAKKGRGIYLEYYARETQKYFELLFIAEEENKEIYNEYINCMKALNNRCNKPTKIENKQQDREI